MTEKQLCSDCKHLEHDGMAGIWCGVRGNNKNYDCPKFEYNWGRLTKEEAINHLNRLYYENKQLKQAISDWKGSYDELYENCEKLEEENEQLKETINELRDMDKEEDIEIEHINNIYKEFGFKGIIDYAKDKLQNYGIVREVDNGLWLLATGGWSDNEFWLDCLLNWNFMYGKGYYRATTSGGGYYYTETPYEDIEIKKKQIKG